MSPPPTLPVEIWLKICKLACVDDGRTGRALSGVSRYVRMATCDFHWRVLAVHGPRQARRLLDALHAVQRPRHIRHMYMDDPRDYLSALAVAAMAPRADEIAALRALLDYAAATVETLTIVSYTSRRTTEPDHLSLDGLRFPALTELTLRGAYSLPLQAAFAPKLALLHISCDVLLSPFARLIPKFYPQLAHVRVSRLEYAPFLEDTLRTLCSNMRLAHTTRDNPGTSGGGGGGGDIDAQAQARQDAAPDVVQDGSGSVSDSDSDSASADGMWTSPALPQARGVLIEPGPGHWIGPGGEPVMANPDERTMLLRLLQEEEHNLAVLPEHPGSSKERDAAQAKAQWLDRLNGGSGCWAPLTGKKVQRIPAFL